MIDKKYIAIGALALAVSFAFGRYSVSPPEVKTTAEVRENVKEDEAKDTHVVTTTKVIEQPSGAKETDTTTTTDTQVHETAAIVADTKTITDVIPPKKNTLNVSALAGITSGGIVYGGSVTKEVLGPITVGAFGLTNGTLGVSVGISF